MRTNLFFSYTSRRCLLLSWCCGSSVILSGPKFTELNASSIAPAKVLEQTNKYFMSDVYQKPILRQNLHPLNIGVKFVVSQHVRWLCFCSPNSLLMIVRINVLCLSITMKPEVWHISRCWGWERNNGEIWNITYTHTMNICVYVLGHMKVHNLVECFVFFYFKRVL